MRVYLLRVTATAEFVLHLLQSTWRSVIYLVQGVEQKGF